MFLIGKSFFPSTPYSGSRHFAVIRSSIPTRALFPIFVGRFRVPNENYKAPSLPRPLLLQLLIFDVNDDVNVVVTVGSRRPLADAT